MNEKEFLQKLLSLKEWHTFECKRALIQPAKLLETMVAFANSDGGTIVIGLEDPKKANGEKRLLGISENLDNVSNFLTLINKEIEPVITPTKFEIPITNINGIKDNLMILTIEKSDNIHSLKKGDTFVRNGNQNIKIGSVEIIRLKREKGAVAFEKEIPAKIALSDLDEQLLDVYKKNVQSKEEKIESFLKDNGLALIRNGKCIINNAGALLFCKNPSISLGMKCGIKISHYYGDKISYSGKPNFVKRPFTIEGPLINQIEKAVAYFKETVNSSPPKLKGATFVPSLLIPEWAFQEAVTNAVIHRNYFTQNDIQIRFFDTRIEIESPGTYPGHITVNNIRHERFSRNPTVERTLNRFRNAPNLDSGEGVNRIFSIMK
ncbi:MAG TPA: RNA-binding domain-containing protein, partial [Elusimicrobiales bacterium]|nr:RNA-binding domain-containing protein [Elusimicrobiales bacterium]